MSGQRPQAVGEWSEHATAVAVGETGILIRGKSGSGKSSLALALLASNGAGSDHARLVGDDRLRLQVAHGRLLARSHARIEGLIEQRGEGLLEVEAEPAAVIRCVVDLVGQAHGCDTPPRFPDADAQTAAIGAVRLPRLTLPQGLSPPEAAWRVRAFVRRLPR